MNLNDEIQDQETDTGHEENHEQYDARDQISRLESQIEDIKDLISKTVSGQAGKSVAEEVEVTDEQALQFAKDPTKLALFIKQKINDGLSTFNKSVASKSWDEKAYDEYPNLKEDRRFQDAVKKEIQDLVAGGDMTKSSPKLVYVATQLAASKLNLGKKQSSSATKTSTGATSLPAGGGSGASTRESGRKISVSDADSRIVLAQKLGWSKEKIDAFKEKLAGKDNKRVNVSKGRSILR